MNLVDVVAAVMFAGVVAYAVFAGADFGAGVWDLTAGGPERGAPMRKLVDRAIGPVWEANHVWLIFVFVYLWTGFPAAFAAICQTLFVPLALAGFGIVLRGSAFAFRKFAPSFGSAQLFGVLFATSSVLTPFVFGTVAGAVASGRVPLDGSGDRWSSWTGPSSLVGGGLAVLTCAFVAAVFLTDEAARSDDQSLADRCRARALGAGVVTGIAALAGIAPLENDAPQLFDRLTGRALPLVIVSASGGLWTLWALWRRRASRARVGAVVAVASVVLGWGVAQYPWALEQRATLEETAASRPTLWGLVIVFGVAGVTVLPALAYLYALTQRPEWSHPHPEVKPHR
jgi:cytochrome d ubiquinol oxidase subunit II